MGGGEGKPEMPSDESSSGEEDGDEQWKAAISAASDGFSGGGSDTKLSGNAKSTHLEDNENHDCDKPQPQNLKHYQIKAQKSLDDILEKMLVMVKDPTSSRDDDHPVASDGGVRLFKDAPPGILFDHRDELQRPTKKPRILPGEELNEKSKKYRRQVQSAAIDGMHILAAAKLGAEKSLARMKAKEAAAIAASKREEERVAELKRIRGERWLPSIAREMQSSMKARNASFRM